MLEWDMKAALSRLKSCGYECEAGPLSMNTAFQYLEALANLPKVQQALEKAFMETKLVSPYIPDGLPVGGACKECGAKKGKDGRLLPLGRLVYCSYECCADDDYGY